MLCYTFSAGQGCAQPGVAATPYEYGLSARRPALEAEISLCYTLLIVERVGQRDTKKSVQFPDEWKRPLARIIRWRPVRALMYGAIRLSVPRHRVGVAVVAVRGQGEVLLLNHVFHPDFPWGLPGGWLDRGETPQSGALRELREETGLSARLGPLLQIARGPHTGEINVAFMALDVGGSLHLSSEILAARWFKPDTLPSPLLPFSRDAIRAALALHGTQTELFNGFGA